MANESSIPLSLAEVTTDYLTMALREAGVLGQGQVTNLQSRVIGEGAGFMGDVVELTVTFSSDNDDGEHSFVLKIPTATKNREVGQTLGVYEREIRFYRDLQPLLEIRTPRHFFSAMDEAVDPEAALKGLKALDKMPLWLIRLLFSLARWDERWPQLALRSHSRTPPLLSRGGSDCGLFPRRITAGTRVHGDDACAIP
ncbi:MAG: hypothetical protein U5O39_04795 [Gammaproteobacteria bacterium]|nr:hypothetical protein [Gammaproteobacteria bacterium]